MTNSTRARSRCSPSDALGQILSVLPGTKLTDYSTQRMTELMVRFTGYLEKGHRIRSLVDIAEEHVEGFVFASVLTASRRRRPSVATMHLRRSSLRLFFRLARQLDLYDGDPTTDLALPPRSSLVTRSLTNDEIAVCRSASLHSLTGTARSAAWSLAEATARTSEIPSTRLRDLDLGRERVWLHGSNKADPRWGYPTAWGLDQLHRRAESLRRAGAGEDSLLIYQGDASLHSAQVSSCIAIKDTLIRAGLDREPDVRPHSVVSWAGSRVFAKTSCIGEVARRLGMRSLDGAARMIGWQWLAPGSEAGKIV